MSWVAAAQFFFVMAAGFSAAPMLMAQEAAGKVTQYEVSAAWMGFTPKGNVLTNSNRVDFVSDLGIDHMQSQAGFRFLIKPWDRKGIRIEFIPYRFTGDLTTTRSFRFGGVTYPLNEGITAKAALNYVSVAYEQSVVNRPRLELAWQAGVAYIGVRARAESPSAGPAEVNRDLPFPLAGLVVRYSPIPESWFDVRGEIRGMTFGSYGRYIDAGGGLGFNLSPHLGLEAGYRVVDGEGHHATRGAELNFRGPMIRLRLHDTSTR